jgi:hypothetical protein
MEIAMGLEKAGRSRELDAYLARLRPLPVLKFTAEEARLAGIIHGALERTGATIGRADPMIAATALVHDLTLSPATSTTTSASARSVTRSESRTGATNLVKPSKSAMAVFSITRHHEVRANRSRIAVRASRTLGQFMGVKHYKLGKPFSVLRHRGQIARLRQIGPTSCTRSEGDAPSEENLRALGDSEARAAQ